MFMCGINTVVSFYVVMFFFNDYLTQNFMQVEVQYTRTHSTGYTITSFQCKFSNIMFFPPIQLDLILSTIKRTMDNRIINVNKRGHTNELCELHLVFTLRLQQLLSTGVQLHREHD